MFSLVFLINDFSSISVLGIKNTIPNTTVSRNTSLSFLFYNFIGSDSFMKVSLFTWNKCDFMSLKLLALYQISASSQKESKSFGYYFFGETLFKFPRSKIIYLQLVVFFDSFVFVSRLGITYQLFRISFLIFIFSYWLRDFPMKVTCLHLGSL